MYISTATQLWFLLIDGGTFRAKGVDHKYSDFYQERMKSLATMMDELPDVYMSYKKFINDNVFGEGEEEVVHPGDKEQREFMKKFSVEIRDEKARQKGKQRAERAEDTPGFSDDAGKPSDDYGGSGNDQD